MAVRSRLRKHLSYFVDSTLSRGGRGAVLALALAAIATALAAAAILMVVGIPLDGSFIETLWFSLMHVIDPGTLVERDSGWPVRGIMLIATVLGIVIVSTFIGVVTSVIMQHLQALARGHTPVLEAGHTVIFGWSNKIFTLIDELIAANDKGRTGAIVILAERDKTAMEEEIRAKVSVPRGARIICRSGAPMDLEATELVSLRTAKAAIVLAPDVAKPDAHVIKTLLAIARDPNRARGKGRRCRVVAEIREPENVDVARSTIPERLVVVPAGRIISRLISQNCRHPGVSVVHNELLSFRGNEFYLWPRQDLAPEATRFYLGPLLGYRYSDALHAFETCTLAGLVRQGADGRWQSRLNPPMNTELTDRDRLIAIAGSYDSIRGEPAQRAIAEEAITFEERTIPTPERTLVLGWNWRGPEVVKEWAHYIAPESEVVIASYWDDGDAGVRAQLVDLTGVTITARNADTTRHDELVCLQPETFNHVIILSEVDRYPPQEADARTLLALIHLRSIIKNLDHEVSIVSEMLDVRNRDLAQMERADDFIVSDQMLGCVLAQMAETMAVEAIIDEVLASRGSDIYLRPVGEYVRAGATVNFATVVEAASRRQETAIGYRRAAEAQDAARAFGVVINPHKSAELAFVEGDSIVVLARHN